MKVLLIGLGRWGKAHLRAWRTLGADILACDADPAALEAARPDAAALSTRFEDLLDAADAVDVVTPAPAHASVVATALRAGKDVLCEKPLAPTAAEARALADAAERAGHILAVGHVFRFEPALEAARDLVRAGRIGAPRLLRARFEAFKRPRSDGGIAISDAIHFVDAASWILGRAPFAVTAVLRDHLGRGLDDTAFLALEYEGGASAQVEASCLALVKRRDLEVIGERGALACDLCAAPEAQLRLTERSHAPGSFEPREGAAHAIPLPTCDEPLRRELADFLHSVATREPPRADGRAGALAVVAIEAAIRSAREGRRIAVVAPPAAM